VRPDWFELPQHVRAAFEAWAGSRVTGAASQASGFSPGVAARLRLADGRGLFVKAVGPEPNPDSPAFHRREARVVARLPANIAIPRLLWSYDADGWVLLAFEEVHGRHPAQPWRDDELQRVLNGLFELSSALTPSPLGDTRTATEAVRRTICGWQRLVGAGTSDGLDAWSQRHLVQLADLEARAPDAVRGDSLLHFDVRADNILMDDQRVWFVDWPHACTGAAWFDVVGMAPSVVMQGGPPAEEVFARYPGAEAVDAARVTQAVATVAGYFTYQALQPPPPGIPTVRAFQSAQASIAREWLAQRTGWRT
jgi:thiamine kinase-like enzyme